MNSITFLGTGTSQGVPMIGCDCPVCTSTDPRDKRKRTSALVRYEGLEIVIDAGPDFRSQMLGAGVIRPDAILLTHHHIDHIGGLDDVRAFNYSAATSYKKCTPFPIYCESRVQDAIRKVFYYAFAEKKYPGVPEYELVTIDENPFSIKGVTVEPIRAFHHLLPVLGFRFGSLAYITDANRIPEEEFGKLKNLDILVLNTVRRGSHISHFSLDEAIAVAQRVGAKQTFFTHLSHQLPRYAELAAELPSGIEPAYDGLTVDF